eukprot:g899.t1
MKGGTARAFLLGLLVLLCTPSESVGTISSLSPSRVGKGASTSISFQGSTLSGTDKVKFVASGDDCTATGVGGGEEVTLSGGGASTTDRQVTFSISSAGSGLKLCYDAGASGTYADSGLTIDVAELTGATVSKAYKASSSSLEFSGAQMAAADKVKLATDCAGTAVSGGAATSLSSGSATSRSASYTLADTGTSIKVCYDANNNGVFVDTGVTVTVAELTAVSPTTVGRSVQFTATVSGSHLDTNDEVKIATDCAGDGTANIISGGGSTQLTNSGASLQMTLGADGTAKVCISVDGASTFHDTGVTITVDGTSIASVDVSRVSVGEAATYTFTGTGLSTGTKVKIATTCSGDDNANIVAGGGGQSLGNVNAATTSGDVTFTLSAAASSAIICVFVPTANGGTGTYTNSGDIASLTVTSIAVTGVSPSRLGKNVQADVTISGSNLGANDKVKIATSSCNGGDSDNSVGGGDGQALGASNVIQFQITASATDALICVKAEGSSTYTNSGQTITIGGSQVSSSSVNRVAKGSTVQFQFTGFGLGSHIKVKVIDSSSTCSGTDDSANAITGGSGASMGAGNADTTSASISLTLDAASADAKLCMLVPANNGGTDEYANSGDISSMVVTVVELTSISPSTVGRSVQFTTAVSGSHLGANDEVKIATDCAGGDTASIISGGGSTQLTDSGASLQMTLGADGTAKVCLKVDGASTFHDTGVTITVDGTSIASVDVSRVSVGEAATYTFT